jgi:hypothetical protein
MTTQVSTAQRVTARDRMHHHHQREGTPQPAHKAVVAFCAVLPPAFASSAGGMTNIIAWVEESLDAFMWQALTPTASPNEGILFSTDIVARGQCMTNASSAIGRSSVAGWLHMIAPFTTDPRHAKLWVEHLLFLRFALAVKYQPTSPHPPPPPSPPVAAHVVPHSVLPYLFRRWIEQGPDTAALGRAGAAWYQRWSKSSRTAFSVLLGALPQHVAKTMVAWRAQSSHVVKAPPPAKQRKDAAGRGDPASLDLTAAATTEAFERALDALIERSVTGTARGPPPTRPSQAAAPSVSAARGRSTAAPRGRGGTTRSRGAARSATRRCRSPSSSSSDEATSSDDETSSASSSIVESQSATSDDDPIQAIVRHKAAMLRSALRGRGRGQHRK